MNNRDLEVGANAGRSHYPETGGTTATGPLISVVVAVRNGADTLEAALKSVIGQSYKHVELIVIDGGSTDGTLAIIERFAGAISNWVSEPDRGIYDAWNKGVSLCRGEWIGFLGSDDCYLEDAIARYVDAIGSGADPTLEYVSSRVRFVIPEWGVGRVIGQPWQWAKFRRYMCVAHVGSLHHRRLFERYGTFDPAYRMCGDYELLLRARSTLRATFVPAVTAVMRGGGISNQSLRVFEESRRAKRYSGNREPATVLLEKYVAIGKFLGLSAWYRIRSGLRGDRHG